MSEPSGWNSTPHLSTLWQTSDGGKERLPRRRFPDDGHLWPITWEATREVTGVQNEWNVQGFEPLDDDE